MKPSDSNLSVEEYINYFADEDAKRFLIQLLEENKKLNENAREIDDLMYDNNDLSDKVWSLETEIDELNDEIQILKNDLWRLKNG